MACGARWYTRAGPLVTRACVVGTEGACAGEGDDDLGSGAVGALPPSPDPRRGSPGPRRGRGRGHCGVSRACTYEIFTTI